MRNTLSAILIGALTGLLVACCCGGGGAPSAADPGDSDVYTERFAENPQAAKKACLDAAKAQRLKGKERKAFIDECTSRSDASE